VIRPFFMLCTALAAASMTLMAPMTLMAQALKDHDTYQPLDIASDRVEVRERDGRAILRGNVSVTQGALTLTADELVVFYDTSAGTADPALERLDANGNVTLVSASETVNSAWAIYDVGQRVVTMGGMVELTRGDNALNGDRLELDLVTGLAKLDGGAATGGRVRGRFSAPSDRGTQPKN